MTIKLSNYLSLIKKLKKESSNGEFLHAITEAFIRDPYNYETSNELYFNPIEKYYNSDESLKSIFNGTRNMSKKCASELYSLYSKDKMMDFFYQRTDNFNDFKEELIKQGFEIDLNEEYEEDIPSTLCDLLAKIFEDISKGQYETFPPLRKIDFHSLDKDAFKNTYIKDNCLHINGQVIQLPNNLKKTDIKINSNLPYVFELLKIYSEHSNTTINSINDLNAFPLYQNHLNEQTKYYFSALSMKRSVRDLFTDGVEHFNILKDEIYDCVYDSYFDLSVQSGFDRLKNVLDAAIKANLNSSILLNIKGLVTVKEKKGICHLLVNEGRIKSWLEVDYA